MAVKELKTSTFSWEGTDKKGAKIKGESSGQSPALVKAQLRKQGINPGKVRKKSASILSFGKRIKAQDIALFTRQMATMMKAGVPLLQSFDIIGEGFDNPVMRKLVDEGKLDLDRDVSDYLGWKLRSPFHPDAPVTLAHLLSHRAGLSDKAGYVIPLGESLAALFTGKGDAVVLVMQEIRLPRALLGLMTGAALGLSGAAMQGYLRNPLAEPGLIGVSAIP